MDLDPERGTIDIVAYQTVVPEVEDKDTQISLEDARLINKKYKIGDRVCEKVSAKEFGRIAAQTAKQVIMQNSEKLKANLRIANFRKKKANLLLALSEE